MSAGAAREDVGLIESLRWDGTLHRTERHLRRMASSAGRLGLPFDAAEARRAISEILADLPDDRPRKVRLHLGPDGRFDAEAVELAPLPDPLPALLVDVRTDPDDRLLYHKTDCRRTYERARERAQRRGHREAVFRNARGEVTEGSFTNLFARFGDGWRTPPVSCGLLPGVYRAVLLERLERVEERVLRPADLGRADEIWLCNSVRGRLRARLTVPGDGDGEGG